MRNASTRNYTKRPRKGRKIFASLAQTDYEYHGGCRPDEDPADYIKLPLKGVIIA